MKFSQNNVGTLLLGLVIGVVLTIGGMALLQRTQPAPIVIVPPEPTPTLAPTVTPGPIQVYVNGAVAETAVYTLPPHSTIQDAIGAAGGFTNQANQDVVNLAQPLFDGAQVYVPTLVELAATPTAVLSAPPAAQAVSAAGGGGLIDINQANTAELDTLPGIGLSTAESIIDYRTNVGRFTTIEEIMNVPGIGEAKFNQIKELITTGSN